MSKSDTVLDMNEGAPLTDDLHFQDIAHSDSPEDPPGAKVQTHTFTNFPDPHDSDEDLQSELLKGEKKQASFWTFEYYQGFFDVDSYQVLRRIIGSMLPNPKWNYLERNIRPNPDLYGPFWICITLVFTTAIAGNLANYIQYSGQDYTWQYDFHKVTFAATAIFGYWWLMPTMLYGLLWWRGSQAGYTFSEILCVYGYSLAIYIPISILWVIQISWLQWMLVMIGMALSGTVLVLTFWPAVSQDDRKISMITMAVIVLFHGLLAIGFVLYFFHVPSHVPTSGMTTPATIITNTTAAAAAAAQNVKAAGFEAKPAEMKAPGHDTKTSGAAPVKPNNNMMQKPPSTKSPDVAHQPPSTPGQANQMNT